MVAFVASNCQTLKRRRAQRVRDPGAQRKRIRRAHGYTNQWPNFVQSPTYALTIPCPRSPRAGRTAAAVGSSRRSSRRLVSGRPRRDDGAGVATAGGWVAPPTSGSLDRTSPVEVTEDAPVPGGQIPDTDAVTQVVPVATGGAVPRAIQVGMASLRSSEARASMGSSHPRSPAAIIVLRAERAMQFTVPLFVALRRAQVAKQPSSLAPLTPKVGSAPSTACCGS